ncbi:MAG TPA: methyltransferase domain-containing protein [Woeseiaceae bacterium]|nr:methyltransferase domain-containing protein [Woeseiaceae bacterium]
MNNHQQLDDAAIRRNFARAASQFDSADFVHTVTRDGLLARLEAVVVDATEVLDLGCATGKALPLLAKRFRRARVTGIDSSRAMLQRAKAGRRRFARTRLLQCDARALPFADHSIDVVFANQLLPWFDDLAMIAAEVRRVLRKEGLFIFSTLGPDSLSELKAAWSTIDQLPHVHHFPDMHDVGDTMVRAGLKDPVLDVDRLEVTYTTSAALFRDLTAAGARNCLKERVAGLAGKQAFVRMTQELMAATRGAGLRFELELVYGHCWGSGTGFGGGPVRIDAASIPIRRR